MLRVKTKIVEKGFHANNNKVYIRYELNWTIRDVIIYKLAYKSDN